MKNILTDVHTHTAFSPDGKDAIEDMLAAAAQKGAAYYGIAEHFDYDYQVNGIGFEGCLLTKFTDPELYFSRGRALKKQYAGRMEVLLGGEFGYTDNPAATPLYLSVVRKYRPDFIVNSVHTDGRYDYLDAAAFYAENADGERVLRDKKQVYREYFSFVKRSLSADYPYDVVGHLTYCVRGAPYADRRAAWEDYSEEIDGILSEIVLKGKILEVNSSCYGAPAEFLPDRDILRRYFALGGRNVSFASDAHGATRVLDGREKVVAALKAIGFEYICVPICGKYLRVEI